MPSSVRLKVELRIVLKLVEVEIDAERVLKSSPKSAVSPKTSATVRAKLGSYHISQQC